jgi:hypothetical protein
VGTNDFILIAVALFFLGLLLAIRQEERRKAADRRHQELGAPAGAERRGGDRRQSATPAWALRALARRIRS